MSDKQKTTHNRFCNYEIAKAKSSRIFSVPNNKEQRIKGIKTANVSKEMLAMQLAELF